MDCETAALMDCGLHGLRPSWTAALMDCVFAPANGLEQLKQKTISWGGNFAKPTKKYAGQWTGQVLKNKNYFLGEK